MSFLCWHRPSRQHQKACISKARSFNYDAKYRGASARSLSSLKQDKELSKAGFFVNHARVFLGSGLDTFEKGRTALQSWRQYGMKWSFVDPETPVEEGVQFCVCVKVLLPWLVLPGQIVYVKNETSTTQNRGTAYYGFGFGALQGCLLAGEERFSVEMDEQGQVWFEIVSFSKPGHILSFVGYPWVKHRQKDFASQSTKFLLHHITSSNS